MEDYDIDLPIIDWIIENINTKGIYLGVFILVLIIYLKNKIKLYFYKYSLFFQRSLLFIKQYYNIKSISSKILEYINYGKLKSIIYVILALFIILLISYMLNWKILLLFSCGLFLFLLLVLSIKAGNKIISSYLERKTTKYFIFIYNKYKI